MLPQPHYRLSDTSRAQNYENWHHEWKLYIEQYLKMHPYAVLGYCNVTWEYIIYVVTKLLDSVYNTSTI